MQHASVLDIDSIANSYGIDITSQNGAKPNATIISYFYISYNSCVICEKTVFSDSGVNPRTDFIKAMRFV